MNAAPTGPLMVDPAGDAEACVPLRAGPMELVFHDGDLRRIRWGDREVVRRIHGAVRDRDWGTVPGRITGLEIDAGDDSFRIRYTCEHRADGIDFVWQATISGDEDGTLRFGFDGEARSTFLRNRIGLCVLHPIRGCAGARVRSRHLGGTVRDLVFPEFVAEEQPMTGFTDLAGLTQEVAPGIRAELEFSGDAFETEDQRNWIDASFKTYSTPLRLPFPVEVRAGERIRQSVVLRMRNAGRTPGPSGIRSGREEEAVRITVTGQEPVRFPEIGMMMASHGRALDAVDADRLSRLGLSHLRADLRLADPAWPERLRIAARDATGLGAALELAIHLPAGAGGDLASVARELGRMKVDLTRALIFRDGSRSTSAADLEAARVALDECGMAIGAGTDADLYQLNLQPPPADGDLVCWSMNPQVHASDEMSIAETPEAVVHQVAGVRRRFPDLPLVVSPVTLKPRSNPVATGPERAVPPGALPPQVDVRQMSLFCAAWTVAMLKALSESGVESITLFETTGWRGVLETATGSPLSARFPSTPGSVFPVYHVLADVGGFSPRTVVPTEATGTAGVVSLLLGAGGRRRLLLANLSMTPRLVSIDGLGAPARVRILDGTTLAAAMLRPEEHRGRIAPLPAEGIRLAAHAIVTIDLQVP